MYAKPNVGALAVAAERLVVLVDDDRETLHRAVRLRDTGRRLDHREPRRIDATSSGVPEVRLERLLLADDGIGVLVDVARTGRRRSC